MALPTDSAALPEPWQVSTKSLPASFLFWLGVVEHLYDRPGGGHYANQLTHEMAFGAKPFHLYPTFPTKKGIRGPVEMETRDGARAVLVYHL